MPPDKKSADSGKMPPPPGRNVPSRNMNSNNSEDWKTSGQKGLQRIWSNYKKLLRDTFNKMSRYEQEDLIEKFAMIITIGVTCILVLVFYPFIPRILRVLGLPLAFIGAWWAGRRVVAPVVIDRLNHLLKKEEREDFDQEDRSNR